VTVIMTGKRDTLADCLLMSASRCVHFSIPINPVLVITKFGPWHWDTAKVHFIYKMVLLVLAISCDDVTIITQLVTW